MSHLEIQMERLIALRKRLNEYSKGTTEFSKIERQILKIEQQIRIKKKEVNKNIRNWTWTL